MHTILLIGGSPDWTPPARPDTYRVTHATNLTQGVRTFCTIPTDVVIIAMDYADALETVIGFRNNRLPEARFVVLLKGDPELVPTFQKEAAVYGVRQVDHIDASSARISEMMDAVLGNTVPA